MFRARPVAPLLLLTSSLFSGCGGDDEEKFTPITDAMCVAGGGEVEPERCSMNRSALPPRVVGGGLCCVSGLLTDEQCAAVGGNALNDPGNGSLKGCPSGSRLIAAIANFEGGFCCTP
jgi:hypothetical protein